MGDSWRPQRSHRDQPPPPRRSDRADHYVPNPPPPLVDRMTFTSGGGLNYDTYRPGDAQRQQGGGKHSEFTFTTGRPGPQFPPTGPSAESGSRQKRSRGGASFGRNPKRGLNSGPSQPQRRLNGARGGGFRKPAPHERALLQNRDGGSPERTLGVAEGSNRFKLDLDNLSDDEETDMDVESDSSSSKNEDDQSAQPKVAKVQATNRADGNSVPKWSNPDPYTVLPPPEETTGKKRDFVKLIRKAKNDAAEKAAANNAVTANDDFISFGDDDNSGSLGADEEEELLAFSNPPLQGSLNQVSTSNGLANAKRLAQDAGLPERPPHPGKAHKRKREEAESVIVYEWMPHDQSDPCPWVGGHQSYAHLKDNPLKWLHNEILDFHDYVKPLDLDQSIRNNLVSRIQKALGTNRFFPYASGRIYAFGSFPTGMYLPTADMDLVYTSDQHYRGGPPAIDLSFGKTANQTLRKAARRLEDVGIATNVVVIAKARVPILKFVDKTTSIHVDLSFENLSGVEAQATFEGWKNEYPDMPFLVALLKQFLVMRGLNDVHTGGFGGFTIICLVVNYLNHSPKPENLGECFVGFLDFYGNQFDLSKSRIQMAPPRIVKKTLMGIDGRQEKPDGLSIQDPNRPENNISGGSRKAPDIFKAFSMAHQALKDRMDALSSGRISEGSILECILAGNYDSYNHHRRRLQGLR